MIFPMSLRIYGMFTVAGLLKGCWLISFVYSFLLAITMDLLKALKTVLFLLSAHWMDLLFGLFLS